MELENFQGIITKYNVDSNGSSISVTRTEEQQIHPLKFNITTGIIDELEGFTVLNKQMYPVRNYEDLQNANQYWVDYAGGRVYFHKSLAGSAVKYKYGDKGQELLSASRIFTRLDEKGNVVELLSDLIDQTREYIAILGTFADATVVINKLQEDIATGNTLHGNLVEDIATGTPLHSQLDSDIKEASKWKDQLKQDVADGKALQPILEKNVDDAEAIQPLLNNNIEIAIPLQEQLNNDIQEAIVFKDSLNEDVADGKILQPILEENIIEGKVLQEQLSESIENAQDDIATINSTGNDIINILSSEWVYNAENNIYEKEISHNCHCENIIVVAINSNTKDVLFLPWKIVDEDRILVKSDVVEDVTLILSARYYRPFISSEVEEQEVMNAREGQATLLDNMIRKINYEDFNGDTIN